VSDSTKVKDEARRLVERLPDEVTWDDVVHEIYVRQAIEAGLADSDAGRTTPVEEVRRRFGLPG
jgi:predicted transcriptional regulator